MRREARREAELATQNIEKLPDNGGRDIEQVKRSNWEYLEPQISRARLDEAGQVGELGWGETENGRALDGIKICSVLGCFAMYGRQNCLLIYYILYASVPSALLKKKSSYYGIKGHIPSQ